MANTIIFNQRRGKAQGGGGGDDVKAGNGIEITKESNTATISAKTDNKTIKVNTNNEIEAVLPILTVKQQNGLHLNSTTKELYMEKATKNYAGAVIPDDKTIRINKNGQLESVSTLNRQYNINQVVVGDGLKRDVIDSYTRDDLIYFAKYIYSNGGKWITTDITDITNISFDLTIIISLAGRGHYNIFGAVSSTNPKDRLTLSYSDLDKKLEIYYGTDTANDGYMDFACGLEEEVNIHFDKNGCIFTNLTTGQTKYCQQKIKRNIILDKPLQIFGINHADSGGAFDGYIGRFIINVNNKSIYDCVPFRLTNSFTLKYLYLNLIDGKEVYAQGGSGFNGQKYEIDSMGLNVPKLSVKEFQGATAEQDGIIGGVPAPTIADKNKFLKGDGTWTDVAGGGYTEGQGIKIQDGILSAKIDGDTIIFNKNNQLVSIGTGVVKKVDQTNGLDLNSEGTLSAKPFKGCTEYENGTAGVVPFPIVKDAGKFLSASGSWEKVPNSEYTAGDGIKIENNTISQNIIEYSPSVPVDQNIKLWIKTE